MSNIDPTALTQLVIAITTLIGVITGILKSISNGKKADNTQQKLDHNTELTKQIATTMTNGATPPKDSNDVH